MTLYENKESSITIVKKLQLSSDPRIPGEMGTNCLNVKEMRGLVQFKDTNNIQPKGKILIHLQCSLKIASSTAYSYRKNTGFDLGSDLKTRRKAEKQIEI